MFFPDLRCYAVVRESTVPFGDRLIAVSIGCLWGKLNQVVRQDIPSAISMLAEVKFPVYLIVICNNWQFGKSPAIVQLD
jgi:hypothetical protein